MAEKGCVDSARKAAVGLLDFHKMVEKYRQVVASRTKSSSSGSSGKRNSCEEQDSDVAEDACGPLKRQRSGPLEEPSSSAEPIADTAGLRVEFAVPHLPARRSLSAPLPSKPAGSSTATWTGTVWQSANDRDIPLCRMSVPLPLECAQALEDQQALVVEQMAQRKLVKLGKGHRVCKCSIVEASPAQLSKLRSMAQNELVGLVPFGKYALILVPYVDSQEQVRLVAFCLAT